ncbi:MAG: alginate lyase family protein [Pseudomonas sp.]
MPTKHPLTTGVTLLLCLGMTLPAAAANTIWPARETSQSAMIGDYRAVSCPQAPPEPYTGHLQLDSKYDQSDASKTTLTDLSRDTQRIRDQVDAYHHGLNEGISRFERANSPAEVNLALGCLHTWLESWARDGALLSSNISGTGRAVRKWSLAAISSRVLKLQALTNKRYSVTAVQRNWLQQLSQAVMYDYGPRQTLEFDWFNNHDYWAAWAITATGMVLDRNDYLHWSARTFVLALQQMEPGAGGYRYLPLEMARDNLAVDYHHYALVPLVLMAQTAEANGRKLTRDEWLRLGELVNLAALGVLREGSVSELTSSQDRVSSHKMVWLLPFLSMQPRHALALELYSQVGSEVGYYGQVGGDLRPFYPDIN